MRSIPFFMVNQRMVSYALAMSKEAPKRGLLNWAASSKALSMVPMAFPVDLWRRKPSLAWCRAPLRWGVRKSGSKDFAGEFGQGVLESYGAEVGQFFGSSGG